MLIYLPSKTTLPFGRVHMNFHPCEISSSTSSLVATSIAEEGLDIPEVDLVVFYEPIPSEIRYIQRRGRTGRKTAGNVPDKTFF